MLSIEMLMDAAAGGPSNLSLAFVSQPRGAVHHSDPDSSFALPER